MYIKGVDFFFNYIRVLYCFGICFQVLAINISYTYEDIARLHAWYR